MESPIPSKRRLLKLYLNAPFFEQTAFANHIHPGSNAEQLRVRKL
jgi:hypothetical protein